MCCECCSVTQRKIWVFGIAAIFIALGTSILIVWPNMADKIVMNSLKLQNGTAGFENFVEAPIPIYLSFYLFNWTNPEEIRNPNVKPNFVEMGPYVYLEKHLKQNLTFYPNDTVSYFQKRTWFFDEQRSKGKLDDMVTTAHIITATVADKAHNMGKTARKVVNFMLNHEGGMLYTTKSAREWIFEGFEDNLIDFLNLFNTTTIEIPYTRFAWLVDRNNSAEYDGMFTIHTGVNDMSSMGLITNWNGKNESGFFEMPCGTINGTTGDIFPPKINKNKPITLFAPDICRYVNLVPNGTVVHNNIEGGLFVGNDATFDTGSKFPNQKCFCSSETSECSKTGVIDCKKCRFGAPVYASFPHFYLADKSYREAISGMKPDSQKHQFKLAIEPYTGVPLAVNARVQLNMLLRPDPVIDIYRNVQEVLMPMFWFEQSAMLDDNLAKKAKLGINLGSYGQYMGIAFLIIGGLLIVLGIVLSITKRWKRAPKDDEDILTTQNEIPPT